MASQLDVQNDALTEHESSDRIDHHLRNALEAADDDQARYHLREALQLQLAEP